MYHNPTHDSTSFIQLTASALEDCALLRSSSTEIAKKKLSEAFIIGGVPYNELTLQSGGALLSTEHGQQVVSKGVGDVLGPVGVWALTSHIALDGKSLTTLQRHYEKFEIEAEEGV
jgi:hypothetical protein